MLFLNGNPHKTRPHWGSAKSENGFSAFRVGVACIPSTPIQFISFFIEFALQTFNFIEFCINPYYSLVAPHGGPARRPKKGAPRPLPEVPLFVGRLINATLGVYPSQPSKQCFPVFVALALGGRCTLRYGGRFLSKQLFP